MIFLRADLSRVAALARPVPAFLKSGRFLPRLRAIPRGAKEENMQFIHEITQLFDAMAALVSAITQLICAMRRPP